MAAVPSIGRAARVERPAERGSEATRDLYERFSGQIYGYCLHQLGSREEAEDAVQTTFMNAFRGLKRGIVPQVESAWLFKIAHNVCLSRRRSTWRRGKVEAPNNLEVLQEVVPAREQTGDELIRLPEVLEEMPESQRRAILLREWQGLSYREIADELELSQSAVETLIFRARRALAAGLEVEPERPSWRKRARHGVDAGGALAALKTLFTGGTAIKVAATVAVATTAAVAASGTHHRLTPRTPVAVAPPQHTLRAAQQTVRSINFPRVIAPAPARSRHAKLVVSRRRVTTHRHTRTAPVRRPSVPPAVVAPRAPAPSAPVQSVPPRYDVKPATPVKKHDDPPKPEDPLPPAATKPNPGRGHDKQPTKREAQSQPQPLPAPAADGQSQGQGQQGNGDHGQGNGHK